MARLTMEKQLKETISKKVKGIIVPRKSKLIASTRMGAIEIIN
jgi:hypothetical protein